MRAFLNIVFKNFGWCILTTSMLVSPKLMYSQSTSVWQKMELTGGRFKIIGSPTVPPKNEVKVPLWIPVTTGGVIGGAITWIILTKDDSGPTTNPPIAVNDAVSVLCGETTALVNVLANDSGEGIFISNTSAPSTITISISESNLQISGIGPQGFSISYTITDTEGRTANGTVTVEVSDSEPPTVLCPADQSVNCGGGISPNETGTATGNDVCAGNDLSFDFTDDNSGLTGCNNTGTIIRNWTATDHAGNTGSCSQTITILPDEVPPNIDCPSSTTIQCDVGTDPANTGFSTSEDNCSGSPTIDFSDDVSGLTGCNGTGILVRTFTATDACGLQQSCTQEITIQDNNAPTISCPDNITISCENSTDPSVTGTAAADDACGTNLSTSFEDDDSGLTGCSGTGDLVRTWTATDACGNAQSCLQTISIVDETPPQITCPDATLSPCTSPNDPVVTGLPTYSDNCSSNVQLNFEDDDTGVLNCSGDLIRTFTATDDCGNSSSCDQTITITDDAPPIVTCPASTTVECGGNIDPSETGNATAEFSCGSPTAGMIDFSDDNSGLTGCNGTGTISRTWTATDSCGLQSSCSQTITIQDTTPPTVSCPPNISVQCDQSTNVSETGMATGSDECGGSVEILFNDDSSRLNGCNGTGVLIRNWSAADECGNIANCSQQITVIDTTVPTISCPSNTTAVCLEPNDPSVTGQPVAADNCSANTTTVFDDNTSGVVNCVGELIRIWTAIDDCGNVSECVQIITIIPPECMFTVSFDIQDADCGVSNGIAFANVSPPSGNYSFEWSNGSTGPVLSDVSTGNFSVTITEIPLSCFLVFDVSIGELPASYVSGIEVVPADCPTGGDIGFMVSSPGSGPIEINVNGPFGNFTITNVPNGAEVHLADFVNVVPGNYNIQVFDLSTGPDCIEVFSVQVDQAPPYQLEVIQVNPPSSPSNNDGSIVLTVNDPNHPPPYTIFLNGNPIGNTPDVIIIIQNLPEGIYEIQVTDANECPSDVVVVELFAMSKPGILVPVIGRQIQLPNLISQGTVEHPSSQEWSNIDYWPLSSQSVGMSLPLKNRLEIQLGVGSSVGIGVFVHPDFADRVSALVCDSYLTQVIQKPIKLKSGTLRIGAVFSQTYSELKESNSLPKAKFTSPWQFGLGLQTSFECKLKGNLCFRIPLSYQMSGFSERNFWIEPTVVLDLN